MLAVYKTYGEWFIDKAIGAPPTHQIITLAHASFKIEISSARLCSARVGFKSVGCRW